MNEVLKALGLFKDVIEAFEGNTEEMEEAIRQVIEDRKKVDAMVEDKFEDKP